ncbi:MAG TPA: SusC/RagA family TonB-linked outer membrane protein, partial [Sphingobacterium sp.]|nr:SusC/RagA family TonB-linked outer membrane protein [Sphingobacterium sp.]
ITWEIAKKTNIGFETNLFNAVDIQADFFKEYRSNILMLRADIPSFLGFASGAAPMGNIGEASSRGFDMSIDYKYNFGQHTWLSARANFTYATSKYEVYEEPQYPGSPWKSKVGYSINQQWGYVAERLFVDDEEVFNSPTQMFGSNSIVQGGDIKYRDINNDGEITELDMVPIGNPTSPEIVYGFGFSLGHKNFDISAFFQGLAQESFWFDTGNPTDTRINTIPFVNNQQMLQAYADSYWNEQSRDVMAIWPRLSNTYHQNNMQTSTWFMRDGTFLRLKNVEVGYNWNTGLVKRMGLENLRIYGSGTNLLTWSKFKLWDVEMAGNGLGYPIQRVFNMGVQVSF